MEILNFLKKKQNKNLEELLILKKRNVTIMNDLSKN